MPMQTTAEYINAQQRHRRKGKEHYRGKGQEKGRGYEKREQVPRRAQTRGYSGENTHIKCQWKLQQI